MKWPGEPNLGGWYTQEEIDVVNKVLNESLDWREGFKATTSRQEFEHQFAKYIGCKYAISINGAGTGLDMAMKCLNPSPNDEIISCSINFPGTHLAILGSRAKLILAEACPYTLNIDINDAEVKITKNTRAIVVTHMNGFPADIDALELLAKKYSHPKYGPIKIIHDVARSCGAEYHGQKIGKKGWISVFSFQTKKLMTTLGEGGMVTTNDFATYKTILAMRGFGDKKIWGTNYLMSKIQAEVGKVQLRRLDTMNYQRIKVAEERTEILKLLPDLNLPPIYKGYKNIYYLYNIILPNGTKVTTKDSIMKRLEVKYGIGSVVANLPTYKVHKYIKNNIGKQKSPISENIASRLFCPSLHPMMSTADNEYISNAIVETCRIIL